MSSEDPSMRLARRLRSLRAGGQAGRRITQEQLADALGVSVPLISSWERQAAVPPQHRLEAYAAFFASERSGEREPLLRELLELRHEALDGAPVDAPYSDDLWRFPHDEDVTIVCSELPKTILQGIPYTIPEDPDYVELYQYPDLDALLELFGHVRAVNPDTIVHIRGASTLTADDYTSHLVLLGGVDWNEVTATVLDSLELPVRQLHRVEESDCGAFEVVENDERQLFMPIVRKIDDRQLLIEDVAHFYRSPSPYNRRRTVTICNGMFARGTYGAVRSLTDARLRKANNDYVRTRFAGEDAFSIISRVVVMTGTVVTPDWTNPDIRLHEWPTRAQ